MKEQELNINVNFSLYIGFIDNIEFAGLSEEDKKEIEYELKKLLYEKYKKNVKNKLEEMHFYKEYYVDMTYLDDIDVNTKIIYKEK